jgi:hypothetical protein
LRWTSCVSFPEHLDGDVAGEWRPTLAFECAEGAEDAGECGVVAARHGETDVGFAASAFSEFTIDTADFYNTVISTGAH